ncbi:hypothetical protein D3C84_1308540 [compost metagenome]
MTEKASAQGIFRTLSGAGSSALLRRIEYWLPLMCEVSDRFNWWWGGTSLVLCMNAVSL